MHKKIILGLILLSASQLSLSCPSASSLSHASFTHVTSQDNQSFELNGVLKVQSEWGISIKKAKGQTAQEILRSANNALANHAFSSEPFEHSFDRWGNEYCDYYLTIQNDGQTQTVVMNVYTLDE